MLCDRLSHLRSCVFDKHAHKLPSILKALIRFSGRSLSFNLELSRYQPSFHLLDQNEISCHKVWIHKNLVKSPTKSLFDDLDQAEARSPSSCEYISITGLFWQYHKGLLRRTLDYCFAVLCFFVIQLTSLSPWTALVGFTTNLFNKMISGPGRVKHDFVVEKEGSSELTFCLEWTGVKVVIICRLLSLWNEADETVQQTSLVVVGRGPEIYPLFDCVEFPTMTMDHGFLSSYPMFHHLLLSCGLKCFSPKMILEGLEAESIVSTTASTDYAWKCLVQEFSLPLFSTYSNKLELENAFVKQSLRNVLLSSDPRTTRNDIAIHPSPKIIVSLMDLELMLRLRPPESLHVSVMCFLVLVHQSLHPYLLGNSMTSEVEQIVQLVCTSSSLIMIRVYVRTAYMDFKDALPQLLPFDFSVKGIVGNMRRHEDYLLVKAFRWSIFEPAAMILLCIWLSVEDVLTGVDMMNE
ncbi:hypothetical protein Tco_0189697 [Tanacetum coccineum]